MEDFNVGDLFVGLGHTGLIQITKVMKKRVEVGVLNPRTPNVICWTSCLKSKLRPATTEEVRQMTRLQWDEDYVKFNVGDKIICVDDKGQKTLEKGKIYTVLETDDYGGRNRVYVSERRRFSFLKDRFQLIKEVVG